MVDAEDYIKLPPHNKTLEEAVLGAILIEEQALLDVINILTADCFYDPNHFKIYDQGILPLFKAHRKIDILTVTEMLKSRNLLDDNLSAYFITCLTEKVASAANIQTHVFILKEYAIKRGLILACSKTLKAAYQDHTDALSLLESTGRDLDQIGIHLTGNSHSTIYQILSESMKEIELASRMEREITGVPSGFYELDRLTAGWQKSDLIIIASRPGMGKTTLAFNLAENAAIQFEKPGIIFSLEMASMQLGNKAIASQTGIDLNKLRTGNLSTDDWKILNTGITPLTTAPIFIDDQPAIHVYELRAKLRRLKAQYPDLAWVIIDYLQLMTGTDPDNKQQTREQQISYISRSLKTIAKELDLPLIALSQLSRSVETRGGDKKPQLSDLRESGAIEADADVVIFIYRPEYYGIFEDAEGNDIRGQALITIAKHRNGPLDEIKLGFLPKCSRFVSLEEFYKIQQSKDLPIAPF